MNDNESRIQSDGLHKQLDQNVEDRKKEMLEKRNIACNKLIEEVLKTNIVHDENGNEIEIPEEVKSSFIEEINKFINSDSLMYVYCYEESEYYSISDELIYDSNEKVSIRVTTNDYPIAAKHRDYYRTIDEILLRYMNYINYKNEDSKMGL